MLHALLSFFSRLKNWIKENPILTVLLLGSFLSLGGFIAAAILVPLFVPFATTFGVCFTAFLLGSAGGIVCGMGVRTHGSAFNACLTVFGMAISAYLGFVLATLVPVIALVSAAVCAATLGSALIGGIVKTIAWIFGGAPTPSPPKKTDRSKLENTPHQPISHPLLFLEKRKCVYSKSHTVHKSNFVITPPIPPLWTEKKTMFELDENKEPVILDIRFNKNV